MPTLAVARWPWKSQRYRLKGDEGMPLYQVQDSDRPLWVVAKDWQDALAQWKAVIAAENDGDDAEPQGIQHVCDNDELVMDSRIVGG
jgi:hypothetical protein